MDMDTDFEIDGRLVQQFSSMGTTDKDVLIAEFQRLVGNGLNPTACAFFLDMTNWNLQAAVGAYYDFDQPGIHMPIVPCMSLMKDVTVGDGESIQPNTPFTKSWRIQNAGQETWPPGCSLRFLGGTQFGPHDRVMVPALQPGAVTEISVQMVSPRDVGIFQGQWRMQSPTGIFFGEIIWVIVQVEECGVLGVTQQLSSFNCGTMDTAAIKGSPPMNNPNPFGLQVRPGAMSPPFCSPPPPSPVHSVQTDDMSDFDTATRARLVLFQDHNEDNRSGPAISIDDVEDEMV